MPELPELEALRRVLGPQLQDSIVTGCQVEAAKAHLLRYPVDNFESEVPFRRIVRTWRRGKHLCFDLELVRGGERRSLVVNPMLGGRFQLAADGEKRTARLVFTLRLEGGRELRYLDLRDMGRIYWTADPDADVPAWRELGPEVDEVVDAGLDAFRKRLRRLRDELKDLLRNQAFVAGIGNAYSDEILFEAGLLPLRRRASLTPEDEERLFAAIPAVLGRAVDAILANPDYDESRQDRGFMKVHGKGGRDCPRCGHRISQLGSNREPLNFCRGCQH